LAFVLKVHGVVILTLYISLLSDCSEIKMFEICRVCKLARLRAGRNWTNILQYYQTLLSVDLLQFAEGAESLSEMDGSCYCIEHTVADSREWVVFLLAS
jgi:hypothetical protein